jgi:hypothetical protein
MVKAETKLIVGLCALIALYSCGLFAWQTWLDALEAESFPKSTVEVTK